MLVVGNTFGKILLVKANTLSPNTPKIFALFQQKVWTKQNYNKFIHKVLHFFNPKKVWTALSIA